MHNITRQVWWWTHGAEVMVEGSCEDVGHAVEVLVREEGEGRDDGLGIEGERGELVREEAVERSRVECDVRLCARPVRLVAVVPG